jgi:hypothetical protein
MVALPVDHLYFLYRIISGLTLIKYFQLFFPVIFKIRNFLFINSIYHFISEYFQIKIIIYYNVN